MNVSAKVYIGHVSTSTGLGGLSVFSTKEINALKALLATAQGGVDANAVINAEQTARLNALTEELTEAVDKLAYLDLNAYSGDTARLMEQITGETSGVTLLSDITGEK